MFKFSSLKVLLSFKELNLSTGEDLILCLNQGFNKSKPLHRVVFKYLKVVVGVKYNDVEAIKKILGFCKQVKEVVLNFIKH